MQINLDQFFNRTTPLAKQKKTAWVCIPGALEE